MQNSTQNQITRKISEFSEFFRVELGNQRNIRRKSLGLNPINIKIPAKKIVFLARNLL